MSYWNEGDISGFNDCNQKNIGQINNDSDSVLGNCLYELASNDNYFTFLEIGTWNGLGSTKCFIDGFSKRLAPFSFYSLECNTEKCNFAKDVYKNIDNVHILNEVLLNDMPHDIYNVFPEILENKDCNYWNTIDFNNMKDKPLFLNRIDLPDKFDIIFFDGGEFTTWYEYNLLKDKCKIIILDDTNTLKCSKIVSELKSQSNKWKLLFESNERNGTIGFELI